MLRGTKLPGDWPAITEPVVPASSHLPYVWLHTVCRHLFQENLGADCSKESVQEGRGAAAALGREQGFSFLAWGVGGALTMPRHSCPFRLVGAPGSSSRVIPASDKSNSCACKQGKGSTRGVGNESSQPVLSHIYKALVSDRH